jgi:selenocysteine lyase/cysteine desulfurase
VTYNDPPMKFEAGTPGIVQMIGLGVALDYMMGLGMDASPPMRPPARLCARAAGRAELAERAGHDAGQGGDLLLHHQRRGACP